MANLGHSEINDFIVRSLQLPALCGFSGLKSAPRPVAVDHDKRANEQAERKVDDESDAPENEKSLEPKPGLRSPARPCGHAQRSPSSPLGSAGACHGRLGGKRVPPVPPGLPRFFAGRYADSIGLHRYRCGIGYRLCLTENASLITPGGVAAILAAVWRVDARWQDKFDDLRREIGGLRERMVRLEGKVDVLSVLFAGRSRPADPAE